MLSRLSEYGGNAPGKLQSDIYGWYASQDRYKNKLNILNAAAQYKAFQPQLSQLRAQALYGKNKKYSITALEKYTSCPFAYYVERGLRARPQEEKRIEKSHIGSLIHSAVRDFCERVESGADSISEIRERWSELTDDAGKAIIRSVIDDMKRKILPRAETNKGQVEYLLDRCERTLEKSVATIRMSLADGDYAAVGYEKDFEVAIKQGGGSVTLYGTIDRIDIAELAEEKKANIRIIDYKSGRKSFSVSAICSKTDMQLVLYAAAASELYKDGLIDKADPKLTPQISAVMYNKINDDIISIAKNSSELAENEIKKRRKLDGVVILDEENGVVSCENAFSMDRGLEEGGNSDFLKLSLKSDGSLSSASQVMTRDTFNLLSDYMKKTVITTDKEIMSGKIDIKPCVSSSGSACDYCDFGEICMFDSGRDSVRKAFSDDGAALEFIKKEMSEDE